MAKRNGTETPCVPDNRSLTAQRAMQALRRIGVDALVAAFERTVIGSADRSLLRDFLLRKPEAVPQLAQPIGITRSAGILRRAAASLHCR
jgi:hypothetical protein